MGKRYKKAHREILTAVEVCGRAETVGFLPAFHISPSVRTGAASPREKLWVLPRQVQKIAAENSAAILLLNTFCFLINLFSFDWR